MKQNLFNKLWLRVGMIVAIMTTALAGTAWAESYNVTYDYSDLGEMLIGGQDANSYWKVPESSGNSAVISIPITNQPTSDITITFNIATFGSGTNPSSSNTTITAVGTETGSNWTGSGVSSYPSDKTYVNGVMTITKPSNPTTLGGLDITIGVNTGVKIFRLQSVTISYTYGGSTPVVNIPAPTLSPAAGTVEAGTTVTISNYNQNYLYYYTTDGSVPAVDNEGMVDNGTAFPTNGLTINSTTTLKVIATDGEGNVSPITSATYTVEQIIVGGETLIFDFEDNTAHRTSGSNSYTGTNTYLENDATITLTYADAVTSGSPISGTANVIGRIAKNTTNSPVVLIGPIDITNKIIQKIEYKTKGVAAMSQVFATSLDNSNWTTQLSLNEMPTQATTETVSELSITGTQLYLRWTVSVESSTGSNRDFQLDDVVITYTESSNPVPTITASDAEIAYNATTGSFSFTINNPVDGGTTTVSENVDWISNATVSGNTVTFTTTVNEATTSREGVITLTYTYGEETTTKDVTVTQAGNPNAPGTENNPYTVAQALAAPTANGVYVTGIISTITEVSTEHGNATYRISDDGTTTNEMIIYRGKYLENEAFTSADQIHVGDIVVVTGNLTVYQGANQLGTGNHLVSIESNSTTPIINATDVTLAYDATSGEITYSITNPADGVTLGATTDADWVSGINVTADKVTFSTTANETGSVRTATFTLTYTGATDKTVTVTQEKLVVNGNYTLATSITSGKKYVIAAENEGTIYVMAEQRSNNRGAVEATITDGVLSVSEDCEFVIESVTGGFSIYDEDVPGYLYAAASDANQLKTQAENNDNGIWTITIDATAGEASVVAEGSSNRNVMHFNPNKGNPIFSCYAENSSVTNPVYFYEKVEPETESVTVTDAGYATYCSENALDFTGTDITAYVGTIEGTHLTFTQIAKVPANTGLFLKAEGGATVDVPVIASTEADQVQDNCLTGVLEETTLLSTDYILNMKDGKPGFYKAGTYTTLAANRAYIRIETDVKFFLIELDDDATGISTVESFTEEGAIYNVAGQRLSKMQKGINIVNGKKILK